MKGVFIDVFFRGGTAQSENSQHRRKFIDQWTFMAGRLPRWPVGRLAASVMVTHRRRRIRTGFIPTITTRLATNSRHPYHPRHRRLPVQRHLHHST